MSYLYEFGLFGLAAFGWLLISNLFIAIRVKSEDRLVLVLCHVGYIALNMSTMAIWTLEGAMLYALLLGQTWYRRSPSAEHGTSPVPSTPPLFNEDDLEGPPRR